ncbi:MAG: sulfatase, partial [Pirellulales bacterium]|nr:sulfatase [Pirellulales bacterium]
RAVCLMGQPQKALPLLIEELQSEREWIRVAAAGVLDEIGEQARPALGILKKVAEGDRKQYETRISRHAVARLEK